MPGIMSEGSQQVLSPGVQDADESDLGAQVLRIGRDFQAWWPRWPERAGRRESGFRRHRGFNSCGKVNTTWK